MASNDEAAPKIYPAPRGWSRAGASLRGDRVRRDHVGEFLGRTSPATGFDCHYCGLDRRDCDCH